MATIAVDLATETAEQFFLPPLGVPLDDLKRLQLSSGDTLHPRHLQMRSDDEVLPYVSSVHLACGLHSGDPITMARTASVLHAKGVELGAHPSYPDLFRFGQHRVGLSSEDLTSVILYQFGALAAVLRSFNAKIDHVKCHGALAFDISYEEQFCEPMIAAVRAFDPNMIVVFMAGSPGLQHAKAKGLRVASEGYIDRGYDEHGRLVPRGHPQALVKNPALAGRRAVNLVCDRYVESVDGKKVQIEVDTLCLHSDTDGAGRIASAVFMALQQQGVEIRPLRSIVK